MEKAKTHWKVGFWKSDLSLSYLLFFLCITVFLIYPISNSGKFIEFIFSFFVILSFLSGIFSVTYKLRDRFIAIVFSLLLFFIGFVVFKVDHKTTYDAIYMGIMMIYLLVLAYLLLREIFFDDQVNLYRIQGAVAVYILFVLIFSFAYRIIFIEDPASFHFGDAQSGKGIVDPFEFLYFSFIILTTMGYGLIKPVSHYAQAIVMVEALVGVLFPSILIARLVSLVSFKKKS